MLCDELGERPLGDGVAVVDDDDPIALLLRLLQLVGGQQNRGSLAPQLVEHGEDPVAALRIHPDRRLVEQQDERSVEHAAGDIDPPFHSAREGLRQIAGPVGETGPLQRPVDRLTQLAAPEPVESAEGLEVLAGREIGVESDLLRDKAELVPPAARGQPPAEHLDLPRIGDRTAADAPHQGRLAGAVGPEQGQTLAPSQLETGMVERRGGSEALDHVTDHQGAFGIDAAVSLGLGHS